MTQTAPARRVTIVAPRARVDVALPVETTVAELVPALVRMTGADSPAANVGWVLARLDGAPLEAGLTVTAAGLHDGDVVYLRPRELASTPLFFDDVIDAIASAADVRHGSWTGKIARRFAFGATVVAFIGMMLLLVTASPRASVSAAAGIAAAAVLLVAATALARAYSDADAGLACVVAGVPAAFAGAFAAMSHHRGFPLSAGLFAAKPLAVALAAVTVYAVLAAALLADRVAELGALAVAAGFLAAIMAVVDLGPVRAVSASAVSIPIAVALCIAAPMIALRLGRLPLPRVPSDVDSFRSDEQATLRPDVLDQTAAAERILTGLLTGLAIVVLVCSIVLVRFPSQWAWTLAGIAGLVLVLRSRAYAGAAQRAVQLVAGWIILAALGIRVGHSATVTGLLTAAGVLAATGVITLLYAARVIRGRRSPSLARLLDIAESLGLVALLPVAAAVIGVYSAAHGIAS